MNVGAYLGLADAYIGKVDYEAAVRVLQKGYNLTHDETLKNKLDEVKIMNRECKLFCVNPKD